MSEKRAVALRSIVAVLAGFVGIRKRKNALSDARNIRPAHIVAAGVIMLLTFVACILIVVQFIAP